MATLDTITKRLALLAQATRSVVAAVPLTEQLRFLCEQIQTIFEVDGCAVRELEGDYLTLRASSGLPEHQLYPSLSAQSGPARQIFFTRSPVAIENVAHHPHTAFLRSRPGGFRFESYAGAPLLIGDKIIGILSIYVLNQTRAFTPVDLDHLQIVATMQR